MYRAYHQLLRKPVATGFFISKRHATATKKLVQIGPKLVQFDSVYWLHGPDLHTLCASSGNCCFGFAPDKFGVFSTFLVFLEMVILEITMVCLNNCNVLSHFSHTGGMFLFYYLRCSCHWFLWTRFVILFLFTASFMMTNFLIDLIIHRWWGFLLSEDIMLWNI